MDREFWNRRILTTTATLALIGSLLAAPVTVLAAAPANDAFADATPISAFPFSDVTDNTDATVQSEEPSACAFSPRTVWYSVTPAVQSNLRADMAGSGFSDTVLAVWSASGPGFGGLSFVGCATFGGPVTWNAQAGTTYYLQAGDFFSGGGSLHLDLQLLPPPPNDDFANATTINALPFDDAVDASLLQASQASRFRPSASEQRDQRSGTHSRRPRVKRSPRPRARMDS